jgi:hypothetical protein
MHVRRDDWIQIGEVCTQRCPNHYVHAKQLYKGMAKCLYNKDRNLEAVYLRIKHEDVLVCDIKYDKFQLPKQYTLHPSNETMLIIH